MGLDPRNIHLSCYSCFIGGNLRLLSHFRRNILLVSYLVEQQIRSRDFLDYRLASASGKLDVDLCYYFRRSPANSVRILIV